MVSISKKFKKLMGKRAELRQRKKGQQIVGKETIGLPDDELSDDNKWNEREERDDEPLPVLTESSSCSKSASEEQPKVAQDDDELDKMRNETNTNAPHEFSDSKICSRNCEKIAVNDKNMLFQTNDINGEMSTQKGDSLVSGRTSLVPGTNHTSLYSQFVEYIKGETEIICFTPQKEDYDEPVIEQEVASDQLKPRQIMEQQSNQKLQPKAEEYDNISVHFLGVSSIPHLVEDKLSMSRTKSTERPSQCKAEMARYSSEYTSMSTSTDGIDASKSQSIERQPRIGKSHDSADYSNEVIASTERISRSKSKSNETLTQSKAESEDYSSDYTTMSSSSTDNNTNSTSNSTETLSHVGKSHDSANYSSAVMPSTERVSMSKSKSVESHNQYKAETADGKDSGLPQSTLLSPCIPVINSTKSKSKSTEFQCQTERSNDVDYLITESYTTCRSVETENYSKSKSTDTETPSELAEDSGDFTESSSSGSDDETTDTDDETKISQVESWEEDLNLQEIGKNRFKLTLPEDIEPGDEIEVNNGKGKVKVLRLVSTRLAPGDDIIVDFNKDAESSRIKYSLDESWKVTIKMKDEVIAKIRTVLKKTVNVTPCGASNVSE